MPDTVITEYGAVDYLINNASVSRRGLNTCSYDDINYVLYVGITAPLLLTQLFMFLCDQKNSFITGQDIIVDGGMTN